MAVLGIVLIVLAVFFGLGVSVSSTASTTMEVFGVDFGVSVPTVFFLGAVTGAALLAGLWLTKKGLGRGYRRRKEIRELRAQAATSDTSGTGVTQSDTSPELPAGTQEAGEPPADERPAAVTDPTERKQPH